MSSWFHSETNWPLGTSERESWCRKTHLVVFCIVTLHCYEAKLFSILFLFIFSYCPISLIIQGCPHRVILRFTAKPYILCKGLFHRICSKFYKVKHGHEFFWPPASWRLVEAKNTSWKPKYAWRSQFMEESVKWKFLSTSKNPKRIQSDLSYDLRQERYSDLWGHSMYIATRLNSYCYVHSY